MSIFFYQDFLVNLLFYDLLFHLVTVEIKCDLCLKVQVFMTLSETYIEYRLCIGNENYKGAVYVWDARALFTSTIDVLTDHAINRNGSKGFIGPTLGVTINEDEQGEYVTLPGSPDYIVLGKIKAKNFSLLLRGNCCCFELLCKAVD